MTKAENKPRMLDAAIGSRVRMDDYGCPKALAAQFPRQGRLARRLTARKGVKDWYLLELDEPLESAGQRHEQVLIRTRRTDTAIGARESTSAYLLFVPDPMLLESEPIDVDDFNHVGNVLVHTLQQAVADEAEPILPEPMPAPPKVLCKRCGKRYRPTHHRCPECDARRYFDMSPEVELVLKLLALLAVLTTIAWFVVVLDVTIPASVRHSTLWLKVPAGIALIVVAWVVLDRILRRASKP
jgi:hypothetical protein